MSAETPAWLPDPFGRFEQRYWDGEEWTEHVSTDGRADTDPPIAGPSARHGAWHPDPLRRYQSRYWDGHRWTQHVANDGKQFVDPPDGSAAPPGGVTSSAVRPHPLPPTAAPVNPKIQRQLRQAGVRHPGQGGGTLFTEPVLVINQRAKILGSTREYAVHDAEGRQLGAVRELARDRDTRLADRARGLNERRRAYEFVVTDLAGALLLQMERPEAGRWGATPLIVRGYDGVVLGQIVRESKMRSALGVATAGEESAVAKLKDASRRLESAFKDLLGGARFRLEMEGRVVGSIRSDSTEWNFVVRDADGDAMAAITKTWAGWMKARIAKADHYVVDMAPLREEALRPLVIAAAIIVDFELKARR
ncbi:phospholipid scramblase-related protein [Nocardioides sp.]|uniref:phospholipid scramblase-related protein n=1 Tax=Nocardioides sp. TaxID=35761 RepID=UPI003519D662